MYFLSELLGITLKPGGITTCPHTVCHPQNTFVATLASPCYNNDRKAPGMLYP